MSKLVNQGAEGTSRNQNKTLSFFKKGAMIALSLSLVLSTYGPSLNAVKIAGAASGSIKTTDENCVTVNANQYYGIGEHVWLHGEDFDANTSLAWDIDSVPSTTAVASGNVLTDGTGSFCFDAYTVSTNDSGEYKATVDGKHDNYKVKGNDNPGGGDEGDPDPTPQTEDTTPNPEVACGVNGILNSNFETPVVANEQNWDIYDSASSGIGWKAVWRDATPTTFNSISKPIPTKIELQRFVNSWSAQDGHQYTELDSDWDGPTGSSSGEPGSIILYQYLSTTNGATYNISFYTSPRPGTGTAENNIKFDWNSGAQTDTIIEDGTSNTNTVWTLHSYSFTATGAVTRIAFTDMGTSNSIGGFLDNVKVVKECAGDPQDLPDPTFNLHLLKQVCNNYGDVVGNPSKEVADDTGGHFNELAAGDITKPISPAEFAGNENCDSSNGWSFKLSTDQSQTQNVQVYGPTAGAGEFVIAYADLTPALQNALTSGNQIWVSEIIPDNTTANFAAFRCYMDALNGDNLEYITVNPHHIPENIYCIAYNVTSEGNHNPEAKHITGQKFNDVDGQGDKDLTDPGLQGWTIYAGQLMDGGSFDVSSSSDTPVTITGLQNGQTYFMRVTGTFDAGDGITADAQYSTKAAQPWTDLVYTYESYGPELLDLQVNNTAIDWGTFNTGHTYWHDFVSSGADLNFRIYDVASSNNVGSLHVNIYKVVASDITDAAGNYDITIPDNTSGGLIVAEQTQNGWVQTSPAGEGFFTVSSDANSSGEDFGNHSVCESQENCTPGISGYKFNDLNGDGLWNTTDNDDITNESGIAGWTIYLDLNNNGALDDGEPYTLTNENGFYSFTGLATGTYYVREVLPSTWTQITPEAGFYKVTVLTGIVGGNDFGNKLRPTDGGGCSESCDVPTYKISGFVYNDLEPDATKNNSDTGLQSWVVYIDTNDNHALDGSEVSTVTAADGSYSFTGLANGTYNIREVQDSGWTQTEPVSPNFTHVVLVASADVSDSNFGNHQNPNNGGGGGGGGGGSGGGSGGGGGGTPLNPQVLGATTGNPGLTMGDAPTPQVLGESTELPRTGSSTAFLFVVFVAALALRKRFQEAAQSA